MKTIAMLSLALSLSLCSTYSSANGFTLPTCYHNGEYMGIADFTDQTDAGCIHKFENAISNHHFTLEKSDGNKTVHFYHGPGQSLSSNAAMWIVEKTVDNPHECNVTFGNAFEPNL